MIIQGGFSHSVLLQRLPSLQNGDNMIRALENSSVKPRLQSRTWRHPNARFLLSLTLCCVMVTVGWGRVNVSAFLGQVWTL